MNFQRIEILLGRIFLIFLASLAAFLMADYVSGYFLSSRSSFEQALSEHTSIYRHPKPYVMFGGEPSTGDLNELGYPGPAPQIPKPADEFRIIMLGGSTVFIGEPPIARLLEETFHANGQTSVRVYNFGVISSVAGMELARAVHEVPEFQPDLVILYNGGNDITSPLRADPRPGYPYNFYVYEHNPILEPDFRHYPGLTLLALQSNILRTVFYPYFYNKLVPKEQLRRIYEADLSEWRQHISHQYVNNVIKTSRVCAAFGIRFIGFLQPMVYYKEPLSNDEKKQIFRDDLLHTREIRQMILSSLEKYKSEHALSFYDLSDAYDGIPERVFEDYIHTLQKYKPVIVSKIHEKIVSDLDLTNRKE